MKKREPEEGAGSPSADGRRKTVRVGRQFATSIATRLDAHPHSPEGARLEDERMIIEMAKQVLRQREPDLMAANVLAQFVETHTKMYGFSRTLYDEIRRIQKARIDAGRATADAQEPKATPSADRDPGKSIAKPIDVVQMLRSTRRRA